MTKERIKKGAFSIRTRSSQSIRRVPSAAFSLDKKIYKTGNYDIVFLKGKTPVAVFMIKIYGNGGIKKNNTDPAQLMKSEIEKSMKATATKKKKKK